MRIAFLTSYPLDISIGSGVIRLLQGFSNGLRAVGHFVDIIHPKNYSSSNYLNLANQRLRFNRQVASTELSIYDCVIGSDFDGYTLELAPEIRYFALNAGILADIVRFEEGHIKKTLEHLASREKQNVQKAEKIIVPSRYTRQQIHQLYDVDLDKITVAPLGIDFEYWQKLLRINHISTKLNRYL